MSTLLDEAPAAAAQRPSNAAAHRVGVVRDLISAMMLGQMYGMQADTDLVHNAVVRMLGDPRELRVSLAFASAMGGDGEPARALLAEGIDDWPDAELAKVSLALALKIAGDPAWTEVAERTLAVSTVDDARRFARQLLDTPLRSDPQP